MGHFFFPLTPPYVPQFNITSKRNAHSKSQGSLPIHFCQHLFTRLRCSALCQPHFGALPTTASADFSQFVVTTANGTGCEISPYQPWELIQGSSATTPLVDFHHRLTTCPSYCKKGGLPYDRTASNIFISTLYALQRTCLSVASQYLREVSNQRYNPQAEQYEYDPHNRADVLCLLLEYFQDNP